MGKQLLKRRHHDVDIGEAVRRREVLGKEDEISRFQLRVRSAVANQTIDDADVSYIVMAGERCNVVR